MAETCINSALLPLVSDGIINIDEVRAILLRIEAGTMKIPKMTYRDSDNRFMMTVPAALSNTGKRKTVYGSTQEEVMRNYIFVTEIKKAACVPTMEDFTETVLRNKVFGIKEDTTYQRYYSCYSNTIKGSDLGKMYVSDITDEDLTIFFKQMIRKGYAKGSIRTLKTILNKVFLQARRKNYIQDNVLDYVEIPYKRCSKPEKQKQTFTSDELKRIQDIITETWENKKRFPYSPIFLIMAFTGLRIGEAMALKWSDIDFIGHTITVNKQIAEGYKYDSEGNKIGKRCYEKPPKSESSYREIPISGHTEDLFKELKRRYMMTGKLCEWVVCNRNKKIPTKSNMYQVWNKILALAEVSYATSHKLRKSFATIAIASGVDLGTVSEALGHRDASVTMQFYCKSADRGNEKLRSAMQDIYAAQIG